MNAGSAVTQGKRAVAVPQRAFFVLRCGRKALACRRVKQVKYRFSDNEVAFFMKKHHLMTTVGLVLAASCPVSALAQEDPVEASISLGYVGTSGNTETQTFNAEFLLDWNTENWTHNFKFQALGSREDDTATAERYYLEEKSDYNLTETQYVYVKGSYTDDRFSGYDYQAAVTGGYGNHLFDTETFSLQLFGGVGYRESAVVDGETIEEFILVSFGEELSWSFSDNSSMYQNFRTEIGEDLTVSVFEIGLQSNIMDRLSTKLAFQARHNSDVPVGIEETDTQTSVSLVYDF